MKLDKFDVKILQSLQSNGRQPTARLADEVGLTPSPTWERVRKLEQDGVLRGYHADIAVELLADVTHIIVSVSLEKHRSQDFRRFEQVVAETPEIVECWAVGGDVDYILRFVASDIAAYQDLMDRALRAEVGIERYWTYIVTKSVKPFAGVPLDRLLREVDPT